MEKGGPVHPTSAKERRLIILCFVSIVWGMSYGIVQPRLSLFDFHASLLQAFRCSLLIWRFSDITLLQGLLRLEHPKTTMILEINYMPNYMPNRVYNRRRCFADVYTCTVSRAHKIPIRALGVAFHLGCTADIKEISFMRLRRGSVPPNSISRRLPSLSPGYYFIRIVGRPLSAPFP